VGVGKESLINSDMIYPASILYLCCKFFWRAKHQLKVSYLVTALQGRAWGTSCDRYNEIRAFCYRRWGVGSQTVFLQGWMNRLNALRREVNR
jgi:hypothetical protein